MTKANTDEAENAVDEGSQEEMHCTKCGTYLGQYGHGSNGIVPCPKCREPNVIDYTGEEYVVIKRRKHKRA